MIKYQNIGLLASMVFAVGMVGFNLSDGTFSTDNSEISGFSSSGALLGHLEVIQTDSEGNIKAYQQTDNAVTNRGVNCALVEVFGASVDDDHCPNVGTDYNWISLETGDLTTLGIEYNATASASVASGLIPAAGTATVSTAASGTDTTPSSGTVTITKLFTAGAGDTIRGAALTNSTGALFAYKDFLGSDIVLTTGDSLTVNWEMTMGRSGTEETQS